MPYIYKTAVQAHTLGVPSMRSMVLEYTGDRMCQYLDRQHMLGDNLLVAPIFNENSMGEYYLPVSENGKREIWTNFFTGEEEESGNWYSRTYGYCDIPLMVRPNSIVAVGACDDNPEYDYADNVLLRVFALEDGKTAKTEVYNMAGELDFTAEATKNGNTIVVKTDAKKPYRIELVNCDAKSADGAVLSKEGNSTFLSECKNIITVEC